MFRYNTAPDYAEEFERQRHEVAMAYSSGMMAGESEEKEKWTRRMDIGREKSHVIGFIPEQPRLHVEFTTNVHPRCLPGYERFERRVWIFEAQQEAACEGDTTVRWFTWRRVR